MANLINVFRFQWFVAACFKNRSKRKTACFKNSKKTTFWEQRFGFVSEKMKEQVLFQEKEETQRRRQSRFCFRKEDQVLFQKTRFCFKNGLFQEQEEKKTWCCFLQEEEEKKNQVFFSSVQEEEEKQVFVSFKRTGVCVFQEDQKKRRTRNQKKRRTRCCSEELGTRNQEPRC